MKHKPGIIVLAALTWLVYIATIFINFASNPQSGILPEGTFENDIGRDLEIPFIPSSWVFIVVWSTIYMIQAIWLVYATVLLCKKTKDKMGYLYYYPGHMPYSMYIPYNLANVGNISWLFIWDRSLWVPSAIVLWVIAICLYITIGLSYTALYKHGGELIRLGHKKEILHVRLLPQNALSFYATWVTIASVLGVSINIQQSETVSLENTGTICLFLLMALVALYFALDWSVLDKYSRYTFTPYVVLLLAMVGSLEKNYVEGSRNTIITIALIVLVVVGLVVKITLVIVRGKTQAEPILDNPRVRRQLAKYQETPQMMTAAVAPTQYTLQPAPDQYIYQPTQAQYAPPQTNKTNELYYIAQ